MAQPTNIHSVYDASGASGVGKQNREDLADMIWNISPTETPISAAIAKVKADAVYHEWQTDALANATADTGAVEGDDASLLSLSATTRVGNRCQIFTKSFGVTGTQEVVKKAGIKSQMAYEQAKKMKEMKRDVEATITANVAQAAGSDPSTARKLGGLPAWLTSNVSRGATGSSGGSGTSTATDGTQRAVTETLLKAVLLSCFNNGGTPTLLTCGGFVKQAISGFSSPGNATRYQLTGDKKITAGVSVYESDFGTLKIVPNRFQRARDLFVIDPDYLALAILRPLDTWELAKTGDHYRKQILQELTLEVRNEGALGVVADLNTA